jgi:TolB-like protein
MRIPYLFTESRRRRVFRAIAWYGAATFALLQGLAFVAPQFGWPAWIVKAGVITALVGVPAVALLAWALSEGATTAPGTRSDSLPPWLAPSPWLALAAGVLLVVGGHRAWTEVSRPTASEPVTIAVLPLANLSGRDEDAALVNGLHASLIAELGSNANLAVTGRTSVMWYAGTMVDPAKVAGELGAQYLLEGGAQRSGDRLHLTVRLTDARLGRQVWAHAYQRAIGEVFAVQRELALQVADALAIAATPKVLRTTAAVVDPRAATLFLDAIALDGRTKGTEAIDILDEVVRLEPGFALAWAWLAEEHADLAVHEATKGDSYRVHLPLAKAALARAEALDANLQHAADARYHIANSEGDRDAALRAAQRMYELKPSAINSLGHLAEALQDHGRWEEALALRATRSRMDPRAPETWRGLGRTQLGLARYQDALASFERERALGGDNINIFYITYAGLCADGDVKRVLRFHQGLDPRSEFSATFALLAGDLAHAASIAKERYDSQLATDAEAALHGADIAIYSEALRLAGRTAEARTLNQRWLEWLERKEPDALPPDGRSFHMMALADTYMLYGRDDEARALLERAAAEIERHRGSGWTMNARRELALWFAAMGDAERAHAILSVEFTRPSVNPLGCPWTLWRNPRFAAVRGHAPLRALFARYGVDVDKGLDDYPTPERTKAGT